MNTDEHGSDERIEQPKMIDVLDLFGTIDFDPDWDYKSERGRSD